MKEKGLTERTAAQVPADAHREEQAPAERSIGKWLITALVLLTLAAFAVLSVNEIFGINKDLPSWDDLYYMLGQRTRAYGKTAEGCSAVHFVDVGQGDCALISAGGRTVLIDCGEYEYYPQVCKCMNSIGAKSLDYVIMSHPHSDHMGCMYKLVRRYGAGAVIMPALPESMEPVTTPYTMLMEVTDDLGIPVLPAKPGSRIDLGDGGIIDIVAPVGEYEDLNNYSCVVRYTFGDVSFLFCGDIEKEAEDDILASGADISADVLKVPHHGSGTSSTRSFVQAVSPDYAVFCVGQENSFGHPHSNIVRLYEAVGADIYRTDVNGEIAFVTDGTDITVYTEKTARRKSSEIVSAA